jgi:hypothetical protein
MVNNLKLVVASVHHLEGAPGIALIDGLFQNLEGIDEALKVGFCFSGFFFQTA